MLPVGLYAMHEVLYDLGTDLVAQGRVVLEDAAHRLRLSDPRIEKQLQLLVQEYLVLLVAEAEVLQEVVGQTHELDHPHVLLGVEGHLQEVQHYGVHSDVTKKTLLVLPGLYLTAWQSLDAELVHTD